MTTAGVEEILVLHHSHLDVGYTHSQPVVWELQHEYISQAVDWLEETRGLDEGPRPKWTCEASEPVLRWLRSASEVDRARFAALYAEGRIGLAALRWNTSALIDRDGLQRLVAGKAELESYIGSEIKVACQHDVPGVPWPIADVLLDAGVDFFVMGANLHLAREVAPRPGMFLWEAPSGRKLRVFNGHHYTMFDQLLYSWDNSVDRMAEGWADLEAYLKGEEYRLPFLYLSSTCSPVMWDNAPPSQFLPDLIARWNAAERGPRIRYATLADLRQAAAAIPDEDLQVMRGDWTDYWTFGAAATPIETALNNQAKALIADAEVLGASKPRHRTLAEAADRADLFDEHTWGFHDPSPTHPQARTIEMLNQALAYEANELASFALMDALEDLAGNPVADRGTERVLLCNPSPFPRTITPVLPDLWFDGDGGSAERTYRARRMYYEGRPWRVRLPHDAVRAFEPVDLEPMSWRVFALADLRPLEARAGIVHELDQVGTSDDGPGWDLNVGRARRAGKIRSPFHSLRYDVDSGRILSLVDLATGREVLDTASRFDLFSYVRERPDALIDGTRESFYRRDLSTEKFNGTGWQEWQAIREPATRATGCEVVVGAASITLHRSFEAPGATRLDQRITLSALEPVITLEAELELVADPDPQGIYFALPLTLAEGWSAGFDTAGQYVRLDDDQLPGANRNWITTESFATMADDGLAVTLLTPDAPLVQLGDFRFGPPLDAVPRTENPLLLAWPVNNYWNTNYPLVQAGVQRFRYGLITSPNLDLQDVRRQAHEFSHAPLVWPVTTDGRPASSGRISNH